MPPKYSTFVIVLVGAVPAEVASNIDAIIVGLLNLTGLNSTEI